MNNRQAKICHNIFLTWVVVLFFLFGCSQNENQQKTETAEGLVDQSVEPMGGTAKSALEAKDELGMTKLQIAAASGQAIQFGALVNQGTELNAQTPKGNSALHLAVQSGNPQTVEALLRAGADVTKKAQGGFSPIHYACLPMNGLNGNTANQLAIIRLLLQYKAPINDTADNGCTPLHVAAKWGEREVVELLLKEGAEKSLKDNKGRTAASIAHDSGNAVLAALLESK